MTDVDNNSQQQKDATTEPSVSSTQPAQQHATAVESGKPEPPVDETQMCQWILDIRDREKRETALLELR